MKNLICLLAAASMIFAATAREKHPGEPDSDAPASQYSEKGYKRPGKTQPEFAEKFLNSDNNAAPAGEETGMTDKPGAASPKAAPDDSAAPESAPESTPESVSVGYNLENDISTLVRQACRFGVFIIRQPYGVVDSNGDFYAFEEGKLEVGATYAPGYYLRGGYLFTDATLSPWSHDPKFADLVEPGMMGRLLDATTSADLSTGADYDSIPFNASSRGNVYPGLLYSMSDTSAFASDGFYAASEPGDLEGYIVWLTKSPSQDLATDTDLMITASRKPMTVSDDPARLYPLGRGVTNAIGVIYVTPEITGVGRVDLYLQGVGVEKDGQWSLVFPFTDYSKIFDAEQAVKAPAAETEHKPGKLRKVSAPKIAAEKETPETEAPKQVEADKDDSGDEQADEVEATTPEN